MKTTFNIDLKTIVIVGLAVFLAFGGGTTWFNNKLDKKEKELSEQINLTNALNDSITQTWNKYNEVVSEKLTIQANVKDLEREKLILTDNQEKLIKRVKGLNKDKEVITAAYVKLKAQFDSLLISGGDVSFTDSTVTGNFKSDSLRFDILVRNATALKLKKPEFLITNFQIPNEMFIEFHWDNDSKYNEKPISFSITNTNPMFNTLELDSYAIPEVNKNAIKPTGWKKFKNFFKDRKGEIMIGVIAGSLGFAYGAGAF